EVPEIPSGDFRCRRIRARKLRELLSSPLAELGAQLGEVASHSELPPVLVDDAEIHRQMRGERLRPEGIERNGEVQLAARVAGYGLRRRRIIVLAPSEEGVDELLQRTELVTELLRQRLGEPRDLLAREPRNEPVAPQCIDLVQCDKRHG